MLRQPFLPEDFLLCLDIHNLADKLGVQPDLDGVQQFTFYDQRKLLRYTARPRTHPLPA